MSTSRTTSKFVSRDEGAAPGAGASCASRGRSRRIAVVAASLLCLVHTSGCSSANLDEEPSQEEAAAVSAGATAPRFRSCEQIWWLADGDWTEGYYPASVKFDAAGPIVTLSGSDYRMKFEPALGGRDYHSWRNGSYSLWVEKAKSADGHWFSVSWGDQGVSGWCSP